MRGKNYEWVVYDDLCKTFTKKEVKKVKKSIDYKKLPYFETKVVKVKKQHDKKMCGWSECPKCGDLHWCSSATFGSFWVNGENLDKIKFPVPCSWEFLNPTKTHRGILFRDKNCCCYSLMCVDEQDEGTSIIGTDVSLRSLILNYNIHILKGKMIIFEEEK